MIPRGFLPFGAIVLVSGMAGLFRLQAVIPDTIVVDSTGNGDFRTLAGAVASLPMFSYERTVIFIRNGVYQERIRIDQDYITLRGESRDGVCIQADFPRQTWLDNPDAIGPAVVNLFGDDIILENLTIENTQPRTDIHAFAVYGQGTRIIIQNANIWSQGGDTLSLWNYKEGMYYHRNCDFRGAVDFVCPRGWCFIENSAFHCVASTAALWHAGGYDEDQKLVLRNCSIDGQTPFELGRHHYDAAFYLIDCVLSDKIVDTPIYRVRYADLSKNRPENWGDRVYFYHSEYPGLSWTQDNISGVKALEMTAGRTFGGKWDPEFRTPPQILKAVNRKDGKLDLVFSERISVRGVPVLSDGVYALVYVQGAGSDHLTFEGNLEECEDTARLRRFSITSGALLGTWASNEERLFPSVPCEISSLNAPEKQP